MQNSDPQGIARSGQPHPRTGTIIETGFEQPHSLCKGFIRFCHIATLMLGEDAAKHAVVAIFIRRSIQRRAKWLVVVFVMMRVQPALNHDQAPFA